jgi:H+/Cl- antiporter ClcA
MRKSVPFEIIAATLLMLGAVLLVVVWFPVINPGKYEMLSHQASAPLARYLVGTPVALLMLAGAWHFNRKARRLKQ